MCKAVEINVILVFLLFSCAPSFAQAGFHSGQSPCFDELSMTAIAIASMLARAGQWKQIQSEALIAKIKKRLSITGEPLFSNV